MLSFKHKINSSIMKKVIYILIGAVMLLGQSCKKDFLNVQSPSNVDQDFVFSTPSEAYKVMIGNYELWRNANNGLFYDIDVVGSDSECHPEAYSSQVRHVPEGLYATEMAINYPNSVAAWANLYP